VTEPGKQEKLQEIESIRGHELDAEQARERLTSLILDADEDVRAEAAAAVWEHSDEEGLVQHVLRLSIEDASARVRAKALTALGRIIYEGSISGADESSYQPDELLGEPSAELFKKVLAHLLATVSDEKRTLDERRFALEATGFLGHDPRIQELMRTFWARPEAGARLSAIFAMGRSGDQRWAGPIQEAIASKDEELRLQGIWAAGEAEIKAAGDALVRIVSGSKDRDERIAAIDAASRLGGESVAKLLLAIAEHDEDPELREAAAAGLEEIALLDSLDSLDAGGTDADDDEEADD
jgi:HEAT repeat protein